MLKHERAVRLFHVFIKPQAGSGASEHAGKGYFAHIERVAAQIISIKLNQVEGIEKHVRVMVPISDAIEIRHSVVTTSNRLAIDDAGSRP